MARNSTQSRGRSVVSKAVSLLDAFSPSTRELSLNELARDTGIPLSTAYRLATELVQWGGLERVDGGGYRIGHRLREIGSLAPRRETLRDIALPFMNDLYEATHENIHLAVLDGHQALYVEKITGVRSAGVNSRRGGRVPLHATSAGKVLLAHAPAELVADVVDAGLRSYTPYTITAPGQLHKILEDVRRAGVAFGRQELTLGSVSVAAPVFDVRRSVVAALAVVQRAERDDLSKLAPAILTAAICVTRAVVERAVVTEARPSLRRPSRFAR